jgi:hypothetical protein
VPGKTQALENCGGNPRFVVEKRAAATCGKILTILLF